MASLRTIIAACIPVSLVLLFAGSAGAVHIMELPVANYSFEASGTQPAVADGASTTTIADWATISSSIVVYNPTSAEFAGAVGDGALPATADGSQAIYNMSTSDSGTINGIVLSIPATWPDGTPIGNGAGGVQRGITYTFTVAIGEALNSTLFPGTYVGFNTPNFGWSGVHSGGVGIPGMHNPTGDFEDFTFTCNFDALIDNNGMFTVNVGDWITPTITVGPGVYLDNIRISISDVPEPSSLMLLGLGAFSMFGYGGYQARRRARGT